MNLGRRRESLAVDRLVFKVPTRHQDVVERLARSVVGTAWKRDETVEAHVSIDLLDVWRIQNRFHWRAMISDVEDGSEVGVGALGRRREELHWSVASDYAAIDVGSLRLLVQSRLQGVVAQKRRAGARHFL
jgi:hypothetical protein